MKSEVPRSTGSRPEESRAAHEGGGHAHPLGRAPLPRALLVDLLMCTPSLPYCFLSKNNFSEGFIPFGLHLIFLFYETLKQEKKQELALGSWLMD